MDNAAVSNNSLVRTGCRTASKMKIPQMIIFDYGHTLAHEPDFNTLKGETALYQYITANPRNLTPAELNEFAASLFKELDTARKNGFEIHEYQALRLKNEYLGLQYSVSMEEAERIFWDNTSYVAIMPETDKMLDFLNARNIRTAVISNIGWSGKALTDRLNRLLPENRFEFIIASSEYTIRKPNRMIFELALHKAGLSADDVWYCGDNPQADVEGAAGIGIFPVWYDNALECSYRDKSKEAVPGCEHLHIREWNEMIEKLEAL